MLSHSKLRKRATSENPWPASSDIQSQAQSETTSLKVDMRVAEKRGFPREHFRHSFLYLSAISYYFLLGWSTVYSITYFCKKECFSGKSLKVDIINMTEYTRSEKQGCKRKQESVPKHWHWKAHWTKQRTGGSEKAWAWVPSLTSPESLCSVTWA